MPPNTQHPPPTASQSEANTGLPALATGRELIPQKIAIRYNVIAERE